MDKRLFDALAKLHRNDRGAMSIEKLLIVGIIALPIIIALVMFKDTIFSWFQTESKDLDTQKKNQKKYTPPTPTT